MSAAAEPLRDTDLGEPELEAKLVSLWGTPPGLIGWLSSVDHKQIAIRFIATAFFFMALAGIGAVFMRLQLATPDAHIVGPDRYDQLFTMHGSTMMFLFAVPIMQAFGLYLVPLMIGTRDVAFPRLNAFSYWLYLFGGLMLWFTFLSNNGPDVGWFDYTPLALTPYNVGHRADLWAQMITYTEVSGLSVAAQIIVTVFKMRAPGMSLDRIPIFVWASVVTAFMILFAMPAVMVASTMLILDREGTHILSMCLSAATICCSSTCSGSSATRKCISSLSRPLDLSPRSSRCSRGAPCSATPPLFFPS